MEFHFGEDPVLLQTTVRDFLQGEVTPESIRALWDTETARSPELWKKCAEIGLPGILVPEEHGGMGMSEIESVLLLEEVGRSGLGEPVVASAAVAVPLLVELGDAALAKEWLPKIAGGDAVVAVGHPVSPFVEDAHVADLLFLASEDGALHAVPRADAIVKPEPANDPSRRIASVGFTPGPATQVADGATARALLDAALDRGALAAAAAAIGACDQLLTLAVDYTSERKQFGQPIGAFQAVKHALATVKVKLEYARPAVHRAAVSVASGDAQRAVHVSMAKLLACEAATLGAKAALQAHGAIGYTWEQDLHIWMRRAWSFERSWGSNAFHLSRVRDALFSGTDLPIGPGTTFGGA